MPSHSIRTEPKKRTRKTRKPRRPILKRHIPKTRFIIAELIPERIQDPRAKQIFENALSRGFIKRVPEHIVAGQPHPERFYFVPTAVSSKKDPNSQHQRVVSARIPFRKKRKRTGNVKGSGAPFEFYDSAVLFPFFEIRPGEKPPHETSKQFNDFKSVLEEGLQPISSSQRFFGGMLKGQAENASKAAQSISLEFERAKQDNDPVVRAAQRLGLREPGIPVVFGTVKPRQTIMEFLKTRGNQSKLIDELKMKMSPTERRAFDFSYRRAKPGSTIELKVEKGMELAGIRKRLRDAQVMQLLSLESNIRIDELGNLYSYGGRKKLVNAPLDVLIEKGGEWKDLRGNRRNRQTESRNTLRQWVEVFDVYGFELRPGEGRTYKAYTGFEGAETSHKDYAVYRNGKRVSMQTATREIVKKFATNLALNYHLVDTRLEATFHKRKHDSGGDAIKEKDVTVKGEIADLEDIDFNPSQQEKRDGWGFDYSVACGVIEEFADKISRHRVGTTKWGAEEKALKKFALETFKELVRKGIEHKERTR